jgi:hypothetical protein
LKTIDGVGRLNTKAHSGWTLQNEGSLEQKSFNSLVEQYFGARLPDSLADRLPFPEISAEGRAFILRMLQLMKRAGCPVTEFTPHMLWLLSTVTPAMLPSAWRGRIPPPDNPGPP